MNPAELMMAMDKNESDMNFLNASTATYALAMWEARTNAKGKKQYKFYVT